MLGDLIGAKKRAANFSAMSLDTCSADEVGFVQS
jgi:hypothetical protein